LIEPRRKGNGWPTGLEADGAVRDYARFLNISRGKMRVNRQ